LSRTLASPNDKATAGFTLIETLVALAVVAVSLVAIGALMGSNARGSRQLEQHVALVQAAYNALWLAFPSRLSPDDSPVQSGESMAHPWRAEAEPFAFPLGAPTGQVTWAPQKITLRVRSNSGATIDLETVRLFRRPTQ
jgi:general secretion pathway protein I